MSVPKNPKSADKQSRRQANANAALAEAAQRKQQIDAKTKATQNEKNGRKGLDPARFGDWEVKGIASDF